MNARTAIQRRRKELGLTAPDVARRAGVEADGLQRWLAGRRATIHVTTLERVAAALGLDLAPRPRRRRK